jgi:hypothetical protein
MSLQDLVSGVAARLGNYSYRQQDLEEYCAFIYERGIHRLKKTTMDRLADQFKKNVWLRLDTQYIAEKHKEQKHAP